MSSVPENVAHSSRSRKPGASLVLKLEAWPAAHQAFWAAGTAQKTGRLAKVKHADTLRPTSIRNAARGYGVFLATLAAAGIDIKASSPSSLVTQENVARLVDALITRGNKLNSIKVRIFNLRVALRIMQSDHPLDWLTRPGGVSINELYPQEFAPKSMPDPRALTRLGLGLVCDAMSRSMLTDPTKRACRNGVILALLAAFPIRIGSLAAMRLGVHVVDLGDVITLKFAASEVKNNRALECAVPDHLMETVRFYIDTVRASMRDAEDGGWFWLNCDGTQFRLRGIEGMFRRNTEKALGVAMGIHSVRHGMATALAEMAPRRPGLTAAVLGVSEAVVSEHYRRAHQRQAARISNEVLEQERDKLRLRARTLLDCRSQSNRGSVGDQL